MNPELSTNELLQLIGSDCADTLVEIDHAHLSYGAHYRYANSTTIYNLAGLRVLADQFSARAEDATIADSLVEPSDEQEAKTDMLERAYRLLAEKVSEFDAQVATEKARRATDPVAVAADSVAKQRVETPSREYRAPYADN